MIVTQHHRRPPTQISHKPVVLGYIVDGFGPFWLVLLVFFFGGFGWFWVVPCFSNYGFLIAAIMLTSTITVRPQLHDFVVCI